jgi:hypothetical protein
MFCQKLNDIVMRIFNPAVPTGSNANDAPANKDLQVMRNCIALMINWLVKVHGRDTRTVQPAAEYSGGTSLADLLHLDM